MLKNTYLFYFLIMYSLPLLSSKIYHYPGNHTDRDPFKFTATKKMHKEINQLHEIHHICPHISYRNCKFVGTLQNSSVTWALVQGLNRIVYYINVGDYIGKEKFKVIAIKKRYMILQTYYNGEDIKKNLYLKILYRS